MDEIWSFQLQPTEDRLQKKMIFYSDLLCGSSRHEKISCDHSRLQADTKKIKKKKS
jgi:hypothetical protein